MNAFSVQVSLNSSPTQEELLQILKNAGMDVIQTSSGLCFQTDLSQSEVKNLLAEKASSQVQPQAIDISDANLAPDIKAFLK